jgi:hypothetical protein
VSYSHSDKENLFHSQEYKFAASFSCFLSLYGSEEWQLKGGGTKGKGNKSKLKGKIKI